MTKEWCVVVLPSAERDLRAIKDIRILECVSRRISELRVDPDRQGKALRGELAGNRSLCAAGRYRIIFKLAGHEAIVYIFAVGLRKADSKEDIYIRLKKYSSYR